MGVPVHNYNFSKSKFQSYDFDIDEIDTNVKGIVQIFWTGGWDSSFRVLQLSKKDVLIQPIYLDDNRASADNELRAIDSIANKIKKLKSTKCSIYDLNSFLDANLLLGLKKHVGSSHREF